MGSARVLACLVSTSRRNNLFLERLLHTRIEGKSANSRRLRRHARRVRDPQCAHDSTRDIWRRYSHNLRVTLLADRYAESRDTDRVRERALFVSPRIPSELELQARWFAGDFGKHFITTAGDK
ncbi:MAG: hypothetical protein DME64_14260, partial [Verrucomicrobia bacterium]